MRFSITVNEGNTLEVALAFGISPEAVFKAFYGEPVMLLRGMAKEAEAKINEGVAGFDPERYFTAAAMRNGWGLYGPVDKMSARQRAMLAELEEKRGRADG